VKFAISSQWLRSTGTVVRHGSDDTAGGVWGGPAAPTRREDGTLLLHQGIAGLPENPGDHGVHLALTPPPPLPPDPRTAGASPQVTLPTAGIGRPILCPLPLLLSIFPLLS